MTFNELKLQYRNPSGATTHDRNLGTIIGDLTNPQLDQLSKSLVGESFQNEFVDVPLLVERELEKRGKLRR